MKNGLAESLNYPVNQWSQELEGLRGLASLWVILGHICILTRFRPPHSF